MKLRGPDHREKDAFWLVLLMLIVVMLSGCSTIMPNTAEAIAPNTFSDLTLGIAADVESWISYLSLLLGL